MRYKLSNYIEIFQAFCIFSIVLGYFFMEDRLNFTILASFLSLVLLAYNIIIYKKSKGTPYLFNLILSILTFILFFISMIKSI